MKPEIAALRKKVAACETVEEKLAALQGACAGRKALILSCGPSLAMLDNATIAELSKDRIVFCVKQAVLRVPEATDFHLLNFVNFQHLPTPETAISIYQPNPTGEKIFGGEDDFDIVLPANKALVESPPEERFARRLAITRDFESHRFDRTALRPWGPSILLEIGFYLLLHLGIREAVVVGWDLGPPGQVRLVHFNESKKARLQKAADLWLRVTRKLIRLFPSSSTACWIFENRFFLHRRLGLKMANNGIPADENQIILDCAADLHRWLASQGLDVSLLSPVSHLPAEIPRVTVDELLPSRTPSPGGA